MTASGDGSDAGVRVPGAAPAEVGTARTGGARRAGAAGEGDGEAAVLLVAGSEASLSTLHEAISPLGGAVLRACSGPELLERLRAAEPAMVLLDLTSLGPGAPELVRRVRDDHPRVPVLAMVGKGAAAQEVRDAYGAGAVDVLEGPPTPFVLRSKVAAFAEMHRAQLRLTRRERLLREREERRAEQVLTTQAASLARTTAELTSLNAELHRRQAELQHAMRARNRFYASMSHELRTPINAIIGYGTLLLDDIYGPLNERQRQGLERSHRAALHLLELVNDMLDLSKVEAGKTELALQPVRFRDLLQDLFVTVGPVADGQGCELILHADCAFSVETDPRRVRQVMLNLLSNAIKFGSGRPVEVRCTGWGDGGVEVRVTDQGPGIAPEDLARIFDEFVQLPERGTQGQGTGLGLAISRRLAELLGGSLSVDSTMGEGSTFILRLPRAADLEDGPATMHATRRPADRELDRPAATARHPAPADGPRQPDPAAAAHDRGPRAGGVEPRP